MNCHCSRIPTVSDWSGNGYCNWSYHKILVLAIIKQFISVVFTHNYVPVCPRWVLSTDWITVCKRGEGTSDVSEDPNWKFSNMLLKSAKLNILSLYT